MKKLLSMIAIMALPTIYWACSDDDSEPKAVESEVISGLIEEDQTWTADKIYELAGRVIVADGVTLTIEAGTIVKGREGQGINACALMIARGGKIDAIGTADEPIIFTSILDDIQQGEKFGSNLDKDDRGLWGGLVILGKGLISPTTGTEAQIEGVPAGETLGLYGGAVENDNSGTLRYVSIRHGGTVLSGGSEINGLTLGGVGSGTTISDIEIFANIDDGIELFGGSVSVSNLLVSYQGDDGIDIDQAYAGTIEDFIVIHGGDTDEGLEIDGPEGASNATGKFVLSDGTLIGDPSQASDVSSLADFKSAAQGDIENVVFTGYTAGKKIKIEARYSATPDCVVSGSSAFGKLLSDNLVFSTVQFTGFAVDVYSGTTGCTETVGNQTEAESKVTSVAATGGSSISSFNWTITSELGLLEN
jgi:hypothetical protein